jgi:hypothetical protein
MKRITVTKTQTDVIDLYEFKELHILTQMEVHREHYKDVFKKELHNEIKTKIQPIFNVLLEDLGLEYLGSEYTGGSKLTNICRFFKDFGFRYTLEEFGFNMLNSLQIINMNLDSKPLLLDAKIKVETTIDNEIRKMLKPYASIHKFEKLCSKGGKLFLKDGTFFDRDTLILKTKPLWTISGLGDDVILFEQEKKIGHGIIGIG